MSNDSQFRLWVSGCSHVHTDKRGGRESLADAIRHSENEFEWDVAIHLGDFCGCQEPPTYRDADELLRQIHSFKTHRREDLYSVIGNHDSSGPGEACQWFFRRYVDPMGESTTYSGVDASQRPYAVDGTWEHYAFRVGNLLFLMMADRNDGGPPIGRACKGGYPAGAVSGDTWRWWRRMVEENPDCGIVCGHHHMLKETTVASGPNEGFKKDVHGRWQAEYHGYFPAGAPEGASYLYFVDGQPDAQAFEGYLAEHPGAIEFWLGGHTHTAPDDTTGGRGHVESKWGATFVNCAGLTRDHGKRDHCLPMSRLFTFTDGSPEVRVQCYLHTGDYAAQGWYHQAERVVQMGRAFRAP